MAATILPALGGGLRRRCRSTPRWKTTKVSDLGIVTDQYDRPARLMPALLLMLPAALAVVALAPDAIDTDRRHQAERRCETQTVYLYLERAGVPGAWASPKVRPQPSCDTSDREAYESDAVRCGIRIGRLRAVPIVSKIEHVWTILLTASIGQIQSLRSGRSSSPGRQLRDFLRLGIDDGFRLVSYPTGSGDAHSRATANRRFAHRPP
jgi:hypothetical protein